MDKILILFFICINYNNLISLKINGDELRYSPPSFSVHRLGIIQKEYSGVLYILDLFEGVFAKHIF